MSTSKSRSRTADLGVVAESKKVPSAHAGGTFLILLTVVRIDAEKASLALLLMRDGLPAGALIGYKVDGELVVQLDHVIKPYRDSQISTWLYGGGSSVFRRLGIERIG